MISLRLGYFLKGQ